MYLYYICKCLHFQVFINKIFEKNGGIFCV
nr:MAG TPA: hypothetical protein [Caudoviricetes sp.]